MMTEKLYLPIFMLSALLLISCGGGKRSASLEAYEAQAPTFSEDSAYAYIAAQCQFGPRTMNSAAHDSCGNWVTRKFEQFGAAVTSQYAESMLHDGTRVNMRNIIASVNPGADTRIIVSAHWDSRPWADNDQNEDNFGKPIDGANDGASGVAVMLELARQIYLSATDTGGVADSLTSSAKPFPASLGIDFICWDAEDSGSHGENSSNTWCLGSQYWAGTRHVSGYSARFGINLDMVGSSKTVFYKEGVSMRCAPSVVDHVWSTAQRLGYGNFFKNENCGEMIDDHLFVNRGGIPCIDIIGIDAEEGGFPATWHTLDDNLQHINKPTLKAVGQTILEVLWTTKP